ncbi:MAG: oligoendopeptidase F [Firmicutes bacterium ZCTH02-B6]|nr:MAG: oligoendopeptidase F [Firmicutes bacterium ZCTH02-B6]
MTNPTAAKTLPKRAEIPEAMRWRLEDLYPTDEHWEEDFRKTKDAIARLQAFAGTLAQSPARLAECLKLRDETAERLERVYVYAFTRMDEDSTNDKYQALFDRSQRLYVELRTAISFIEPEILQLSEERLQQYLNSPELALYRHHIEDIVRYKPHTLSPAEEAILAAAGEVAQAPSNVFDMFNDADLKFPAIQDENGEWVELTHGRYIRFMESADRRVRKDAFEALHNTYARWRHTVAATLASSVRKDVFYARTRKYPSALHMALHEENIPVEVYTNLIDTIRSRIDLLHRYMGIRKRLLGVDELHIYDIYVPLVPEADMHIPYEQACQTMVQALKPLGDEYLRIVQEGLANRWVDVLENEGKRSGAYSISAYGVHPYILMNYEPNLDNLFTLAHEFGHACHSYLSNTTQPFVYAQYTIFVAEVASTLNEHLLFHHLLKETSDKAQRRYLINKYLDGVRATVFRQVKFAEFEKIIHEHVEAGEALTPQFMSDTYHGLVKEYYGPELIADDPIAIEWARIPHFYNAFYVYKYATGFAAATALGQAILEEGRPAVERYLNLLRSGSSDYSLNLLRQAGVDMTKPEPILRVMDVFEQMLDELEALA